MAYVVIGGGIAGVTCAEELASLLPTAKILLLSASEVLKGVCSCKRVGVRWRVTQCLPQITNYIKLTDHIEDFDVVEK
jgi:glycine/D-amino acid oxidase-like deaminating enzyme